jgi:hypothetical protein
MVTYDVSVKGRIAPGRPMMGPMMGRIVMRSFQAIGLYEAAP